MNIGTFFNNTEEAFEQRSLGVHFFDKENVICVTSDTFSRFFIFLQSTKEYAYWTPPGSGSYRLVKWDSFKNEIRYYRIAGITGLAIDTVHSVRFTSEESLFFLVSKNRSVDERNFTGLIFRYDAAGAIVGKCLSRMGPLFSRIPATSIGCANEKRNGYFFAGVSTRYRPYYTLCEFDLIGKRHVETILKFSLPFALHAGCVSNGFFYIFFEDSERRIKFDRIAKLNLTTRNLAILPLEDDDALDEVTGVSLRNRTSCIYNCENKIYVCARFENSVGADRYIVTYLNIDTLSWDYYFPSAKHAIVGCDKNYFGYVNLWVKCFEDSHAESFHLIQLKYAPHSLKWTAYREVKRNSERTSKRTLRKLDLVNTDRLYV